MKKHNWVIYGEVKLWALLLESINNFKKALEESKSSKILFPSLPLVALKINSFYWGFPVFGWSF